MILNELLYFNKIKYIKYYFYIYLNLGINFFYNKILLIKFNQIFQKSNFFLSYYLINFYFVKTSFVFFHTKANNFVLS